MACLETIWSDLLAVTFMPTPVIGVADGRHLTRSKNIRKQKT